MYVLEKTIPTPAGTDPRIVMDLAKQLVGKGSQVVVAGNAIELYRWEGTPETNYEYLYERSEDRRVELVERIGWLEQGIRMAISELDRLRVRVASTFISDEIGRITEQLRKTEKGTKP